MAAVRIARPVTEPSSSSTITTPVGGVVPAAGSSPACFGVLDGDLSPEWLERLSGSAAVAVDTEAMGLVHGRDRLCLVQICDNADNVCCIRIARGQRQAPLLRQLLENGAIEKVFHFARFDVAALGEGLGIDVAPLFCTKVASRLARTYTNRHGLKDVVQELCGVELDKGAQSSDWGRVEELSEAQLAYAANDVRFLLAARDGLVRMLQREERLDLALRSFRCIPVIAELDRGRFGAIFEHRS
jgi:ribonuclease D